MIRQNPGWLVVSIDTEEEGLWSGNYSALSTVKNIAAVPRFQNLCDRFSVRPTYLVTTPVAENQESARILRPILDDERCEIGTHVHPWNSPPLSTASSFPEDSFLGNLSQEVQLAKLGKLTDLIESKFGRRPLSFRAGRYGISSKTIDALKQLGYLVDSSVLPGANYSDQNGPDFRQAGCQPYFPSSDDPVQPSNDESLLEVPVTAGFTHQYFEAASRLRDVAMCNPFKAMKAVGILDRSGIATKVKLSPEQATFAQMKQLAEAVLKRGTRILVLMFHSSSLLPGNSPYVKTEQDLEHFLLRLEKFFSYSNQALGLQPIRLSDCYSIRNELVQSNKAPMT